MLGIGVAVALYVNASIVQAQVPPPPPPPITINTEDNISVEFDDIDVVDDISISYDDEPTELPPAPATSVDVTTDTSVQAGEAETSVKTTTNTQNTSIRTSTNDSLSTRIRAGDTTVTDASIDIKTNGEVLIQTNEDVDAFVSITQKRSGVSHVEVDTDSVHVTYQDSGKLLGIFPVSYKSEIVVESDSSVTVSGPWYTFLVVGSKKKNIQQSVSASVRGKSVTASPTEAAQIVDIVTSGVSVYAGSDASIQAKNVSTEADSAINMEL